MPSKSPQLPVYTWPTTGAERAFRKLKIFRNQKEVFVSYLVIWQRWQTPTHVERFFVAQAAAGRAIDDPLPVFITLWEKNAQRRDSTLSLFIFFLFIHCIWSSGEYYIFRSSAEIRLHRGILKVCNNNEKTDLKIKAYNGVLALVSSAQLCVGGVLHIEDPAPHQHCQPCQEQVLHTHKGDPSLWRREENCVTLKLHQL